LNGGTIKDLNESSLYLDEPYMNFNRNVLIDFLHLFALVGFAVAQPLYDLLGRNPEFFVAHRASQAPVIGMVLLLSVGVALGLVLLEFGAWLSGERARRSVHRVFIFGLAVLTVLPMVKRLMSGTDLVIAGIALLMGLVFVVLYVRWQAVRLFVTVLSPVAVAFPLWFLLVTPVGRLVLPDVIGAQTDIEIENPITVVLVILDEFNVTALLDAGGRIDPVRFPNFASLAAESWWFPNAVAAATSTTQAVPAILTSQQPQPDSSLTPTANDYPNNLFVMLGEQYRLKVWEILTTLCPNTLCRQESDAGTLRSYAAFFADVAVIYLHIIMPPRLGQELPSLDARWTGFGGALMDEVAIQEDKGASRQERPVKEGNNRDAHLTYFLSQIEESSNPELYFLHVMLPHVPYEYLASGHKYFPSDDGPFPSGIMNDDGGWIGGEPLILSAYYRYLQQIGYLDRFLGQLRDTLEASRLYDKALIVLTADHGVAFRGGQSRRGVENGNVSDILKVPMIVKLPGQREGRISDRLVSGIDVLPTIADVLGVRVSWDMDGRSMISSKEPPRTEMEIPGVGRVQAKDLDGFPRLEWQVEHFGEHTPLDRLVPKGPYPELIGQILPNLHITQSAALQFYSKDLEYVEHVNPESGFLSALFRAHISGTDDRNLPIAIAFNDQIWTTTTTSEWDGNQNYFSVLLPPAAFKNGENVIGVYQIEEKGGKLLLIDRDDGRSKVRLHHDGSGRMKLVFFDSSEIPINVDRGVMQGNLDSVSLRFGNRLVFEGWGADIVGKRPAEEVLIFAGEQLVLRVIPEFPRQDVADAHQQQALLHSGFRAVVPLESLKSDVNEIKIIMVSKGGRALHFPFSDAQKDFIRTTLEKGGFS